MDEAKVIIYNNKNKIEFQKYLTSHTDYASIIDKTVYGGL